MGQLVGVFAASHAPGLTGWFDDAEVAQRERVLEGYRALRERLEAAAPTVVLMISNDHLLNFPVDATPDLGIDPMTSRSAGRGIPHIASNFALVQASSICPRSESSPKRPPNSKKDPKTTKPQAVEKNANRRGPTTGKNISP